MDKISLVKKLYAIGAIKIGQFVLKSGKTSNLYVDLREAITKPELLKAISCMLIDLVKSLNFDLLCGVPYSALPIATCMSLELNKPMLIVRKEPKDHGTKRLVEGAYQARQTCLLIEDVITTGGSLINTMGILEISSLKVPYVVSLLDRVQGGREALQARHAELFSVLTLSELKQILLAMPTVPSELRQILEQAN